MSEITWTFQPGTPRPSSQVPSSATARRYMAAPVQIETNGFLLRTLVPGDVTPRFVHWLNDVAMRDGLNLSELNLDAARLSTFIAGFDGLRNHFIGIFDPRKNLLVGFYTLDINLAHKTGNLTAGIGEAEYRKCRVYWRTIDALLDHFFIYRDIDKITARVLAHNHAMLFNFVDNWRFAFEARLRQECLGPDGSRPDVLVFSAFRNGPRPQGLSYVQLADL